MPTSNHKSKIRLVAGDVVSYTCIAYTLYVAARGLVDMAQDLNDYRKSYAKRNHHIE
jgi:hypothetical protein